MTATVPDGPDTELAELIRRIGDRHTEDRRMGADDPRCASCAEEAWPCVTAQLVESVGAVLARPAAGRDLTADDVLDALVHQGVERTPELINRGIAEHLNEVARPAVARTDGQPPAAIWPGTPCGTCGHKRNHHAPSGGGCAACFGCDQFVPPEPAAAPAEDTAAPDRFHALARKLADLNVDCTFWACPGPDTEPEDMVTCRTCWLIWEARQLLAGQPVRDSQDGGEPR